MNARILILFLYLLSGVIGDMEDDKIPNWLCATGMVSGFLLNWHNGGSDLFLQGIAGGILLLGVLLPFWMISAVGGGDVKLMMMAGCYLGPDQGVTLLVLAALCTGIYGAFLLCCRRSWRKRMQLFAYYLKDCVLAGTRKEYPFDRDSDRDKREGGIHVSYGILAGYVIGIGLNMIS